MPLVSCKECHVKEKGGRVSEVGGWWWMVITITPKFGKKPKTEQHMVLVGKHLRTSGHCMNVFEAATACGLKFEHEVDSSD